MRLHASVLDMLENVGEGSSGDFPSSHVIHTTPRVFYSTILGPHPNPRSVGGKYKMC